MLRIGQRVRVIGTEITGELVGGHGRHDAPPGKMIATKDNINFSVYSFLDSTGEFRTFARNALEPVD